MPEHGAAKPHKAKGEVSMRTVVRTLCRYGALLAVCVAAGCLLLYLAGLCPQRAVQKNLDASWGQLVGEGFGPGILYEGHPRSKLDNYTEGRILIYSYYMDTARAPGAVLTNPGWYPPEDEYREETLLSDYQRAVAAQTAPNTNYVRYWMGFRVFVRPMLAVMHYMDARQCLMWTFFILLGVATLSLYKRTRSYPLALAFVIVLSQFNPIVISASYLYSACFFIALIGMALVCSLPLRRFSEPMLFFLLGAATQYFDFYTVPVITFGLPMLALLAARQADDGDAITLKGSMRRAGVCFAAWAAAYLLMWIAKLALVTLLSDLNGFSSAFSKLGHWMSGADAAGREQSYVRLALINCFINITDYVPFFFEMLFGLWYVARILKNRVAFRRLLDHAAYLIVALLPVFWITASAKPAYLHMWYQYRGLIVLMFGLAAFMLQTARRVEKGGSPAPPAAEFGENRTGL